MELIKLKDKYEGEVTAGCSNCYFGNNCTWGCSAYGTGKNKDGNFYINKYQIEALIEEAEKRHREKGGLVVCEDFNGCKVDCDCKKPYVFYQDIDCGDGCFNCVIMHEVKNVIAFRGEPTKEEEVQEYVVVDDFGIKAVAFSDINPIIFKKMVRKFGKFHFCKDHQFIKTDGAFFINELERLGFIEKVVHDPVVELGDCFKHITKGVTYRIITCGDNQYLLSNLSGVAHWGGIKKLYSGIKLSDFVKRYDMPNFKPVKIKEVEEG